MTNVDRKKYLDIAYGHLFGSSEGIAVLTDLLYKLCYFIPCEGDGPQALNNLGKEILDICGPNVAADVYAEYFKLSHKETNDGD
jgi:hypothetical protein